jgi:hypothetical protein
MKTVALVDWNWKGHHPTYFLKLIDGFLARGCRVLALCPRDAVDEVRLATDGRERLDVEPCRQLWLRWHLPGWLGRLANVRRVFGGLEKSLRQWESENASRVDLVFFSTIYDFEFEDFRLAKVWFSRPWSGIYLHARAFRMPGTPMPYVNRLPCPEKIFTLPTMSSVCVIDEGAVSPMTTLAKGKPVFEFPDITATEIELPLNGDTLAGKLTRFAAGRKVVVCLGHLQKTKGLAELCQVARHPSMAETTFFFGGEVYWGELAPEEVKLILSTWEGGPNVLTHLAKLSDATINALIKVSDVVFAAYTNFPNSSNIMTKAALLERPIVVSDGHLMAERVRKYHLGSIVPEGSVPDILREISHLCAHGGVPGADYRGYYANHSPQALHAALAKVVDSV